MTNNDQSTTTRTPEMQAWLDAVMPIQNGLLADHKRGWHGPQRGWTGPQNFQPDPGCPSCVFSGALDAEGVVG